MPPQLAADPAGKHESRSPLLGIQAIFTQPRRATAFRQSPPKPGPREGRQPPLAGSGERVYTFRSIDHTTTTPGHNGRRHFNLVQVGQQGDDGWMDGWGTLEWQWDRRQEAFTFNPMYVPEHHITSITVSPPGPSSARNPRH